MELREQTIKEMVRLLSEEQVITDENVIIENEGATSTITRRHLDIKIRISLSALSM